VTTFQRRQRILGLLREQPGITVSQLANLLGVSPGTIRNDLNVLEEQGHLERVHGGAVLKEQEPYLNPAYAQRLRVNQYAKEWIARRAAEMIESGDAILLDASTTVYHMAPYLQDFRNLTIITNGIQVGLSLAQNPTHTVILTGGVINPQSVSVAGHLGQDLLDDLHIKIAFVSATGFSLEAGLTESDIQQAQIKRKMIRAAERVVALVDSSKFGKVSLAPFARPEQISHIITDCNLPPHWIGQLQREGIAVTLCDENTATAFTAHDQHPNHCRIGFANLSEQIPFAVDVRRGLEKAAQVDGEMDLVLADNRLDGKVALAVAEWLIAQKIDLAIEYQIDQKVGDLLMARFREANIPVIAVDIPMVGATFFGVDNYRAGHMAGVALGQWLQKHWGGHFDRLVILEEQRAGALPGARIHGQLEGLQSVVGTVPEERIIYLDSGNTTEVSAAHMEEALLALPHVHKIAVISFNDDAALGAIQAARKLERSDEIIVVGQGADRRAREEIRRRDSRLVGSTAYMPERYGEKLIGLARRILAGEAVPPAVYMEHVFITAENIDQYYPE
jgi:ribose transport system substrate-binding protein